MKSISGEELLDIVLSFRRRRIPPLLLGIFYIFFLLLFFLLQFCTIKLIETNILQFVVTRVFNGWMEQGREIKEGRQRGKSSRDNSLYYFYERKNKNGKLENLRKFEVNLLSKYFG